MNNFLQESEDLINLINEKQSLGVDEIKSIEEHITQMDNEKLLDLQVLSKRMEAIEKIIQKCTSPTEKIGEYIKSNLMECTKKFTECNQLPLDLNIELIFNCYCNLIQHLKNHLSISDQGKNIEEQRKIWMELFELINADGVFLFLSRYNNHLSTNVMNAYLRNLKEFLGLLDLDSSLLQKELKKNYLENLIQLYQQEKEERPAVSNLFNNLLQNASKKRNNLQMALIIHIINLLFEDFIKNKDPSLTELITSQALIEKHLQFLLLQSSKRENNENYALLIEIAKSLKKMIDFSHFFHPENSKNGYFEKTLQFVISILSQHYNSKKETQNEISKCSLEILENFSQKYSSSYLRKCLTETWKNNLSSSQETLNTEKHKLYQEEKGIFNIFHFFQFFFDFSDLNSHFFDSLERILKEQSETNEKNVLHLLEYNIEVMGGLFFYFLDQNNIFSSFNSLFLLFSDSSAYFLDQKPPNNNFLVFLKFKSIFFESAKQFFESSKKFSQKNTANTILQEIFQNFCYFRTKWINFIETQSTEQGHNFLYQISDTNKENQKNFELIFTVFDFFFKFLQIFNEISQFFVEKFSFSFSFLPLNDSLNSRLVLFYLLSYFNALSYFDLPPNHLNYFANYIKIIKRKKKKK